MHRSMSRYSDDENTTKYNTDYTTLRMVRVEESAVWEPQLQKMKKKNRRRGKLTGRECQPQKLLGLWKVVFWLHIAKKIKILKNVAEVGIHRTPNEPQKLKQTFCQIVIFGDKTTYRTA